MYFLDSKVLSIISNYQFNNCFLRKRNIISFKYMYIDYKNCLDFRMLKCGRENAFKYLKK